MYNVFSKMEKIGDAEHDGVVEATRYTVYKSSNKHTLRRLKHEGWTRHFDIPTPNRAIAVAVKRKLAAQEIGRLQLHIDRLHRMAQQLQKILDENERV
jgi:hypothetical protein